MDSRWNRYPATTIRISSTSPIMPRMPAYSRTGVPITHSSARKITSSTNVVPRSSPSITSMHRRPAPGSSGMSRCRQSSSCLSLSFRASRSAPQSRNASLASSEGWKGNGPITRYRVAPPDFTPITGTSSRPTMATNISG